MSTPTLLRLCRVPVTRLPRWILAGSIAPLLALSAAAQSLTWDSNPAQAGIQTDNGDWDGGNFWFNGTTNVPWVSGADANFTGTSVIDATGITVDDITMPFATLQQGATAGVLMLGGGDGVHSLNVSLGQGFAMITLPIAGTEGMQKDGPGFLRVSGVNTYTGATLVNQGVLEIIGGSSIPDNGSVTIASGAELRLGGGSEVIGALSGAGTIGASQFGFTLTVGGGGGSGSFSGVISNFADTGLIKLGTGTQTLSGANTFAGAVLIQEGTLEVAGGNAIGNPNPVLVAAGATLRLLASERLNLASNAGMVDLAGASVLTFDNTVNNATIPGIFSGTGSVVRSGTSTLTLTGANTFSGGLTIDGGGTVSVDTPGANGPLGNGPLTLGAAATTGRLTITGTGATATNRPMGFGAAGARVNVSNAAAVVTLSGVLSGSGALTQEGAGTLVLTGQNSFTGGVTVSAGGTLSVADVADTGSNSSLGAGNTLAIGLSPSRLIFTGAGSDSTNRAISLGSASVTIEVVAGSALTLNGVVSGGSPVTKTGPGTLILAGSNTFSLSTTINEGTLAVSGGNAIPDVNTVTIAPGATLQLLANETVLLASSAGTVDLAGASVFTFANGNTSFTFPGTFTGTGGVVRNGTGTLTLTGANTFTGGLTISGGGTVPVSTVADTGVNSPLGAGGTITLGAVASTGRLAFGAVIGAHSTDRPFSFGAGGAEINVMTSGATLALTGVVSGSGALSKTGPGTFALTNAANSFSGNVSVSGGGTLAVSDVADAGQNSPLGSGTSLTLGTVSTTGRLLFNGAGNDATNRAIVVSNGATVEVVGGAGLALSGIVSGTGVFTKAGTGALTLSGMNTFTGSTTIQAGTLAVTGGDAVRGVSVSAGATFQLLANETITGLSGAGSVALGANTLTVDTNTNGNFAGAISGSGSLTKSGVSTLTLTGVSDFTGGVAVVGGSLAVTTLPSIGTPGPLGLDGMIALGGATQGGTLSIGGSSALASNRTFAFGAGGGLLLVTAPAVTLSGSLTGAGGLILHSSSTGTLTLTNPANSFTTGVTIGGGALAVEDVADSGVPSLLGTGSTITIGSGRLVFTGTGSDASNRVLIYTSGNAAIEVAAPGATLTLDAASGAGGFTKFGAGTLIQTTATNSFTGAVTVAQGTLQTGPLANAGVASALGAGTSITLGGTATSGTLAIASGTTSETNRSMTIGTGGGRLRIGGGSTVTLYGTLSGNGPLTFEGGDAALDTFVLPGAVNTRNGATFLERVKVRVTGGNGLPDDQAVTLLDNLAAWLELKMPETIGSLRGGGGQTLGRVGFDASLVTGGDGTSTTFDGILEGPGSLIKVGAGTFTLTGPNTFTGSATIAAGALIVSDVSNTGVAGNLGAGSSVTLGNASASARLVFTGFGADTTNRALALTGGGGRIDVAIAGATLAWTGSVNGAGVTLHKDGPGTLRLTGANGFTGPTNINAGKLQVLGSNALPNLGTVTIASGAMLELLAGTNETIGALEGAGTLLLGGQRLITGGTDLSNTYAGLITGAGNSVLEKRGAGTFTLTNPASSFTGVEIIDGAISVPFVANAGVNSPLGSAGDIFLGDSERTGRLIVSGASSSVTNRGVNIRPGGGILDVAADGATLALTGPIGGTGALLKFGAGQLQVAGDKTFQGTTIVADGTLRLAGSLAGQVIIYSGTLDTSGSRSIGDLNLAGGIVSPGVPGMPATLTSATTTFSAGVLLLNLDSAAAYDGLSANGAVTFDGFVKLDLTLAYDPADYVDVLRIVMNDGSDPTVFNGANAGFVYGFDNVLEDGEIVLVSSGGFSQQFEFRYGLTPADNDVRLIAVPEPSAALLAASSLLSLGLLARRRPRQSSAR